MNIKILIAAHKEYRMPKDPAYLPVFVGAAGKEKDFGYQRDDQGDNLSKKNPYYCELTALYWGYKNAEYDVLGLVHYRRHFRSLKKHNKDKFENILTSEEIEELISKYDAIMPKKRHYYIETSRSHYLHAHHHEGLDNTEEALKKLYPEYMPEWEKVMNSRSGHRFNMFIMKKDLADKYCKWLFDILFEVERTTDISMWDKSEQRIYGYLSERLIDVFLLHNNVNYYDAPYYFLEKQNWFIKGFNFLKRFITKGKKK